jgi:uncharacterized protein
MSATVFADDKALIFFDEEHSHTEEREIIIGRSHQKRVLLVSFTERSNCARAATKREQTDYKDNVTGGEGNE